MKRDSVKHRTYPAYYRCALVEIVESCDLRDLRCLKLARKLPWLVVADVRSCRGIAVCKSEEVEPRDLFRLTVVEAGYVRLFILSIFLTSCNRNEIQVHFGCNWLNW